MLPFFLRFYRSLPSVLSSSITTSYPTQFLSRFFLFHFLRPIVPDTWLFGACALLFYLSFEKTRPSCLCHREKDAPLSSLSLGRILTCIDKTLKLHASLIAPSGTKKRQTSLKHASANLFSLSFRRTYNFAITVAALCDVGIPRLHLLPSYLAFLFLSSGHLLKRFQPCILCSSVISLVTFDNDKTRSIEPLIVPQIINIGSISRSNDTPARLCIRSIWTKRWEFSWVILQTRSVMGHAEKAEPINVLQRLQWS